ncbi:DNA ligase 1-like [Elysia marginata]|uniref:DNA ligase 1-like n=1 Tax=Elysia marginata TaxID=1093978 RepID=A0AAV4JJ02_9GAST|nr:DNA ligase 1-like [Elysia marginata]
MGCKHSTTIKVQPVGQSNVKRDNTGGVVGKEGSTQTPTLAKKGLSSRESTREFELDQHGNKVRRKKPKFKSPDGTRDNLGSSNSLNDERSMDGDRGFSATSKASADSGLGGDAGGDEYAQARALGTVVTEYSDEAEVRRVEGTFIERDDLDLSVTGVQLPTRLSAKDKTRQQESMILQSLREEGLIAKPSTQAAGGMSFEIVTTDSFDTPGLPVPPPRQLEKLEKRRKKKRSLLTEDQIREKLERAEARRKKREEERLNKLKEIQRTDALASLENFEVYKKERQEQIQNHKMDIVADNRDKRMRDIKAKLQERERRAAEVRRRRQEALEQGLATSGVINNEEEYPTSARDNPAFSQD